MTDNIVNFPGSDRPEDEPSPEFTADHALEKCMGKFDEVVIIGIGVGKAQCVSTVPLDEAIYELSRAIHILHRYIDNIE